MDNLCTFTATSSGRKQDWKTSREISDHGDDEFYPSFTPDPSRTSYMISDNDEVSFIREKLDDPPMGLAKY